MVQLPTPVGRVGIYQSDAQGLCVYVNTALCELFGLTAKEAMGLGWMDRVHPDDRQRVLAARKYAVSPIPVFYLDLPDRDRRQDVMDCGVFNRADGGRHLQGPYRHHYGYHRGQAALSRRGLGKRLVQLVGGRDRQPGDRDALVHQLLVLFVGRLAADGSRRRLVRRRSCALRPGSPCPRPRSW